MLKEVFGCAGIGLQVAKTLAAAGYRVIISSRDSGSGEKAAKDIAIASNSATVGALSQAALFSSRVKLRQLQAFLQDADIHR